VTYVDGRYAYSFAGLAEVPFYQFSTRHRLAEALCGSGRPAAPGEAPLGVESALTRVAEFLSKEMGKLRVRRVDKRTSVLLTGYRFGNDGVLGAELHLVSNFESLDGSPPTPTARDRFYVSSSPVRGAAVAWIGSAEASKPTRSAVLDLMENSAKVPPSEVVNALVQEIRKAADDNPANIGRRCSSIVVLPDSVPFMVDYHVEEIVSNIHATASVVAVYGDTGAFYTCDQQLSVVKFRGQPVATRVPTVHKRQPCPCGSGRRYKNCHGHPKASHAIDSYSMKGISRVLAMPEDGSGIEIVSTAILKK
jgi:hypothetical protein